MSRVYFIGDIHLGHRGISNKFRQEFESDVSHDNHTLDNINKIVEKNDIVYYMGDIAFSTNQLLKFERVLKPHRKILVRGNHDKFTAEHAADVFDEVHGITKYKTAWLSHCPIHPQELFGKFNIHGHVHTNTVPDLMNYINVSAENIAYTPIDFKFIQYYRKQLQRGVDIQLKDHIYYEASVYNN